MNDRLYTKKEIAGALVCNQEAISARLLRYKIEPDKVVRQQIKNRRQYHNANYSISLYKDTDILLLMLYDKVKSNDTYGCAKVFREQLMETYDHHELLMLILSVEMKYIHIIKYTDCIMSIVSDDGMPDSPESKYVVASSTINLTELVRLWQITLEDIAKNNPIPKDYQHIIRDNANV